MFSFLPLQAIAIQLVGVVALTLAAPAPAPQIVTQVHAVPATAAVATRGLGLRALPSSRIQSVRAVPSAVSHSHSSITHETPSHSLVRAISQPVAAVQAVRTVSSSPTLLRTATVAAQPVVHTVAHADHSVVQPALVRAVHAEPAAAVVRTVPVVDGVVGGHAHYSYGYSVNDARSGDLKAREESRDGDVVQGSYTVADPDGRIRHVEYTADRDHGFQARVTYDGEPGPVSLGGPVSVSAAAPLATDAGVIAVRGAGAELVGTIGGGVQTLDAAPATIVRANAVQTVPVSSNLLRTVPSSTAANVFRTVPATTSTANVFRTVPATTSTALVRTVPATVATDVLGTVPASNLLRTVPATTASNFLRAVPAATASNFLRAVPATTATVVQGNRNLLRTQLIEELPAGTQIVQDGQLVRALPAHVIHA